MPHVPAMRLDTIPKREDSCRESLLSADSRAESDHDASRRRQPPGTSIHDASEEPETRPAGGPAWRRPDSSCYGPISFRLIPRRRGLGPRRWLGPVPVARGRPSGPGPGPASAGPGAARRLRGFPGRVQPGPTGRAEPASASESESGVLAPAGMRGHGADIRRCHLCRLRLSR